MNRILLREWGGESLTATTPQVVLVVPCRSIGSANSHLDIANDFVEAAYIGERLAPFCRSSVARQVDTGISYQSLEIEFTFEVEDFESFESELYDIHRLLYSEGEGEDDTDEDLFLERAEEIDEFVGTLWRMQQAQAMPEELVFPELADDYLFNLIIGQYDLDEGAVAELNELNPHYDSHRFLRSFVSGKVGGNVLMGEDSWILESNVDPADLLRTYFRAYVLKWEFEATERL
ncbi:MAG: hypothetical protein JO306_13030, partial [Gemmatimonadetes bacterium]|nr:hypothetical protein [Gemmatimonadota bacterium]